jgi:hypothetical protein
MKSLLLLPFIGAFLLAGLSCGGEEAKVVSPQPSPTASPEAAARLTATVVATAPTAAPTAPPPAAASATPEATVPSPPLPTETAPPDFSSFVGDWGRHGFGIMVSASGEASATWRIYKWCSDDPTPPCDDMTDSNIVNGGRATIVFDRVVGETAYGWVQESTEEPVLSGNVSLTLQDYGMASLAYVDRPESEPIPLCGPNFWQEAPDWFKEQSPCGA